MVLGASRRQTPRSATRRLPLFRVLFGLALGAGLWFAPAIVVNSPLRENIIATATNGFAGQVSVGSISAGWLSPVVLEDVVAEHESGEPLLRAPNGRWRRCYRTEPAWA